jgi:signal transduction histidine kinase
MAPRRALAAKERVDLRERETHAEGQLDELRREVDELRASRRRLAVADDADRRTVERTLHDEVQQHLVGLAAGLQLAAVSMDADPTVAKRLLAEMGRAVQQALEDARRLAHRLAPPLLEAGGLLPALRSAAASADIPSRISVEVGRPIPPEIASAVYFCFLRVLEQGPSSAPVTIVVRADERTLGFEIEAGGDLVADGLGLLDRVEALGGRLSLGSEPGHGTRLVGSVPLSG